MTRHDDSSKDVHESKEAPKAKDDAVKESAGSKDNQQSAADLIKSQRKGMEGKSVLTAAGQNKFELVGADDAYEKSDFEAKSLDYLQTKFSEIDKAGKGNGRISVKDIDAYIKEHKELNPEELKSLEFAKANIKALRNEVNDDGFERKGISLEDVKSAQLEKYRERTAAKPDEVRADAKNFADAFEEAKKTGDYSKLVEEYKALQNKYETDYGYSKIINAELHERGVLPKDMNVYIEFVNDPGELKGIMISEGSRSVMYGADGKPVNDKDYPKDFAKISRDLPGKDLNEAIKLEEKAEVKDDKRIEKDAKDTAKDFSKGDFAAVIKDFQKQVTENPRDLDAYAAELNEQLHKQGVLPPDVNIDSYYLRTHEKGTPGIPLTTEGWSAVYDKNGKANSQNNEAAPKTLTDAGFKKGGKPSTVGAGSSGSSSRFIDPFGGN
ncbi:MAG: hypothetical protein K2X27_07710 [Candidatus Obscuribacterales bacterium]|nr:hypothetical protein [Candidatus Obscuribacterales bacterium]